MTDGKFISQESIYHSYLIRCWSVPVPCPAQRPLERQSTERYIVETVSRPPQRWGFDTLDALIAFLESELAASITEP